MKGTSTNPVVTFCHNKQKVKYLYYLIFVILSTLLCRLFICPRNFAVGIESRWQIILIRLIPHQLLNRVGRSVSSPELMNTLPTITMEDINVFIVDSRSKVQSEVQNGERISLP